MLTTAVGHRPHAPPLDVCCSHTCPRSPSEQFDEFIVPSCGTLPLPVQCFFLISVSSVGRPAFVASLRPGQCGVGVLMPTVIFFGGNLLPATREGTPPSPRPIHTDHRHHYHHYHHARTSLCDRRRRAYHRLPLPRDGMRLRGTTPLRSGDGDY